MILLSTFIPGLPVAQPRVKATAFAGADGKVRARVYTPQGKVGPWRERVAVLALQGRQAGKFTEGPVRLSLRFVFPRPQRLVWKKRPMPAEWMTSKPDVDNLAKSVLDAVTGVLFKDDAQLCALTVEKLVAAGEQPVGAWIHLETIEGPPA